MVICDRSTPCLRGGAEGSGCVLLFCMDREFDDDLQIGQPRIAADGVRFVAWSVSLFGTYRVSAFMPAAMLHVIELCSGVCL